MIISNSEDVVNFIRRTPLEFLPISRDRYETFFKINPKDIISDGRIIISFVEKGGVYIYFHTNVSSKNTKMSKLFIIQDKFNIAKLREKVSANILR